MQQFSFLPSTLALPSLNSLSSVGCLFEDIKWGHCNGKNEDVTEAIAEFLMSQILHQELIG